MILESQNILIIFLHWHSIIFSLNRFQNSLNLLSLWPQSWILSDKGERRRQQLQERGSQRSEKEWRYKLLVIISTKLINYWTRNISEVVYFQASETWQSRVNRVLALLYPFLLLLALGLGAYCCYKYATIYMDSWEHGSRERGGDKINVESDLLEEVEDSAIEDILAEEEW